MSDHLAYVEPERTPPVRYAPCVDHVDANEDAQFIYRETRDGRLVFLAYTSLDRLQNGRKAADRALSWGPSRVITKRSPPSTWRNTSPLLLRRSRTLTTSVIPSHDRQVMTGALTPVLDTRPRR